MPLLLQLFFWYELISEAFPGAAPGLAASCRDVFVSNRGLYFPVPLADPTYDWMALALLVGIAATLGAVPLGQEAPGATGQPFPTGLGGLGLIARPAARWSGCWAARRIISSWPELKGFNFDGGTVIQPEFTALLLGLVLYTSAFIAEIVRSGILAVHKGQSEAAMALGLSRGQVMRLVLLPQALRVIVPPMTSQYLNITKNSSLAIAIGYPDLVVDRQHHDQPDRPGDREHRCSSWRST